MRSELNARLLGEKVIGFLFAGLYEQPRYLIAMYTYQQSRYQ